MNLIYAALILRSAGRPITRDNLNAVMKAAGARADQAQIQALLSLLQKQPAPGEEPEPVAPQVAEGKEATEAPPAGPEADRAPDPNRRGLYVYAVALGKPVGFESPGIEGNDVFTITEGNLAAVVHEGPAEPYSSEDKEVVEDWVLSHQAVVEEACRRYEAVLPMAFDTMIHGADHADATDNLRGWLRDEQDTLLQKAERVRNRREYGVQVLMDVESAAAEVMDSSEAVAQAEEDLSGKSEGAAYFGRRRVQKQVEQEVEERTKEVFRQAFQLAGEHAVEVSVDKLKDTGDGMRMVANLSCLVEEGQEEGLRAAFEEYCAGDGLAVRFAGPLPPYSFV